MAINTIDKVLWIGAVTIAVVIVVVVALSSGNPGDGGKDKIIPGEPNTLTKINLQVTDRFTGDAITGAAVSVDGGLYGRTDESGTISLEDLDKGKHIIEAEYGGVSETAKADTSEKNTTVDISLEVPKSITLTLTDDFTGEAISGATVYIDGKNEGQTSDLGEITIKDTTRAEHVLRVEYKGASKDQTVNTISGDVTTQMTLKAPRTITISLIDSETKLPIDAETVYLVDPSDPSKAFRNSLTSDDVGTAKIVDILPGEYQLRMENQKWDFGAVIPSKYIAIGAESNIDVDTDMPNPRFEASLSCREYGLLGRRGSCTVNVKNIDYERGMNSRDTAVVLLGYAKLADGSYLLRDKRVLDFNSIPIGEEKTQSVSELGWFDLGQTEVVVAFVVEGWKYTPEDTKEIGQIDIPQSILDKFVSDALNWCGSNPAECVGSIAKIVGWGG